MAESLNLMSNMNRVETPFITAKIGQYNFGAYEKNNREQGVDQYGAYRINGIRYPNFVTNLDITKINGQVNKYTLSLIYTVRETDDPNFFEKVFSTVSQSRKIIFSYGDMQIPNYCFREEEAMITNVKTSFNINQNSINYTVYAISSANLLDVGTYPYFPGRKNTKPSDVIKELLTNSAFNLLDIFTGMRNGTTLNGIPLIPDNDLPTTIESKTNMSVLDYLKYLVSSMKPVESSGVLNNPFIIIFGDDTSGELMGPYFKIVQTNSNVKETEAYTLDIGFPGQVFVTDFRIENDETYSIYYDYQSQLHPEEYVQRLNNRGEIEEVYAPVISSGNETYHTREDDKTWWSKVTSYPIKCSVTVKGLLKPVILMAYVKLNVLFFGRKHIASGLYIVTKQQDSVGMSGYRTTLNMVKVAGDDEFL
jgi:hypothetical protein